MTKQLNDGYDRTFCGDNEIIKPPHKIIQKPIPTTLKLMSVSLALGIGAAIMKLIVLEELAAPKQSEIIYLVADIIFLFGIMLLALATGSYIDEHRGK